MCRSKDQGGQRCHAHSVAALSRAEAHLAAVEAALDGSNTPAEYQELMRTREDLAGQVQATLVTYASTVRGAEEVERRRAAAIADGDTAAACRLGDALHGGARERRAARAGYRAWSQGKQLGAEASAERAAETAERMWARATWSTDPLRSGPRAEPGVRANMLAGYRAGVRERHGVLLPRRDVVPAAERCPQCGHAAGGGHVCSGSGLRAHLEHTEALMRRNDEQCEVLRQRLAGGEGEEVGRELDARAWAAEQLRREWRATAAHYAADDEASAELLAGGDEGTARVVLADEVTSPEAVAAAEQDGVACPYCQRRSLPRAAHECTGRVSDAWEAARQAREVPPAGPGRCPYCGRFLSDAGVGHQCPGLRDARRRVAARLVDGVAAGTVGGDQSDLAGGGQAGELAHVPDGRPRGVREAVAGPAAAPVEGAEHDAAAGPVSFAEVPKEQRLEAMRAEIDTALESMARPEQWQQFMDAVARFPHYSVNNTLLIRKQRPDATQVTSFRGWQRDFNRHVRKGEKAIWIMAPCTRKVEEDDPDTGQRVTKQVVTGFRPVAVFDVSQTEGDPLPQPPAPLSRNLSGAAPQGMHPDLERRVEELGFEVSYGVTNGGGYTDFEAKRVVLNMDNSPRQQALTLAHEAAHIVLGHGDRLPEYHTGRGGCRGEMEIEAESNAYVVSRAWGIDDAGGHSWGYIEHWAQGDRDRVRDLAEKVLAGARTLLGAERGGQTAGKE